MNKELLKSLDEQSRRDFISYAAKSLLGVSILPAFASVGAAQASSTKKAQHVIYLFMNGAMSHLDTFDPKPGVEEQGETKAIKTAIPSIQLSEHLPELAKRMKKIAVVRGLSTETGAHQPGKYLMRTSYKEIASTRHPGLGPWFHRISGKLNDDLPGSVLIGNGTQHPLAGFLEAKYAPVPIGNPTAGLQNTKGPDYIDDGQFNRRMSLTFQFDAPFREKYKVNADVNAYTDLYREAIRLLKSKDLEAFDLNKEPKEVKDKYGTGQLGMGCLLARRLIENKVRFVEVDFGGWDNHRDIFTTIPAHAKLLDDAVSTLLDDLEQRGLLNQTLVVVGTEFGRTPKINQNAGRDHHPGAFSGLMAGGPIKGGQVYGESDKTGRSVADGFVSPQDYNATIAQAIGISLEEEIYSPSGRPFTIARGGTPIESFF